MGSMVEFLLERRKKIKENEGNKVENGIQIYHVRPPKGSSASWCGSGLSGTSQFELIHQNLIFNYPQILNFLLPLFLIPPLPRPQFLLFNTSLKSSNNPLKYILPRTTNLWSHFLIK